MILTTGGAGGKQYNCRHLQPSSLCFGMIAMPMDQYSAAPATNGVLLTVTADQLASPFRCIFGFPPRVFRALVPDQPIRPFLAFKPCQHPPPIRVATPTVHVNFRERVSRPLP